MNTTKISKSSNQLKNVFLSHRQILDEVEQDSDFQKLTTNKLNQILCQTGGLSAEYVL